MLVDYDNYKDQDFTCKHCGWQGKGNKLGHGDFSELHCVPAGFSQRNIYTNCSF